MIETKKQFAERMGVHKSTVTRWDKAGRLVLAENGRVKVEESQTAIKATQGARSDVAQRHAQNRGHSLNTQPQAQPGATNAENDPDVNVTAQEVGKDRAYYKAIALDIGNKQLKLDEALNRGIRLDKTDYYADLAKQAAQIKSGIERLIDNLAPQLCKITNQEERQQKLQTEIKNVLEAMQ